MFKRQLFKQPCVHFSTSFNLKGNIKIKNAKGSSVDWLRRHLTDPYVKSGLIQNYRARSAFKLIEIDDVHKFLLPGKVVLDCGAAPGAWAQVAAERIKSEQNTDGLIIATDILNFFPVEGVTILPKCDFKQKSTHDKIIKLLDGRKIDVCLSDMCPNISGVKKLDHERIMELIQIFFEFAVQHTAPGGILLVKVKDGNMVKPFLSEVSKFYENVKRVKPSACRREANEMYAYAFNFKMKNTD